MKVTTSSSVSAGRPTSTAVPAWIGSAETAADDVLNGGEDKDIVEGQSGHDICSSGNLLTGEVERSAGTGSRRCHDSARSQQGRRNAPSLWRQVVVVVGCLISGTSSPESGTRAQPRAAGAES